MKKTDKVKIIVKKKLKPYNTLNTNFTQVANSMIFEIKDPYTFKIYSYLCMRYNRSCNYAFPSYNTIATDCQIGLTKVKECVKWLCDNKYIIKGKVKNDNKNTTNTYEILYLDTEILGLLDDDSDLKSVENNKGVEIVIIDTDVKRYKGEEKIKIWLNGNNIDFVSQKTFPNLLGVGNGNLSYDFYLPDHNLLIEYQGEYHDGTVSNQSEEDYLKRQEHDKRKREYAESHNIKLLEIWYWDFDNIKTILNENIK